MKQTGHLSFLSSSSQAGTMERTLSSPLIASVKPANKFEKTRHKFLSNKEDLIYHISIIDYLQEYNTDKILENQFKSVLNKKDKDMISAVNPSSYQERFAKFMTSSVIVDWEEDKKAV